MAEINTCGMFQEWLQKAIDAKVIPEHTQRIIIDIPLGDCVTVYSQSINTEGLFNDDLIEVLRGAPLIVDGKKAGK